MAIAVLGPLEVDGDASALGPRDRIVIAVLALRAGEVVSPEAIADALWGDEPPASWSKVVQGCVMRLRKLLGTTAIDTLPHGYRLTMPTDTVDAHRFERLLVRGRELMTLGEPERAAHVIGEALALWHGRALIDLEGWEPGRVEAGRLEELRLEAEEARLDASLRAGRHRDVLGEAQALVAASPLREDRWALLALAQYRSGRQGDALRTLHRARGLLAGELGVDPGHDLIALEHAILRQDPSLAPATEPPEPSASCPYLGLVSYDVGDADAFFGRDADVAACLERLAATNVVVVVGPSGSGKSSLVRAGLAAALRRDRRPVTIITPGARPTDALTGLPESEARTVLVVDQCEEAVALCDDAAEQARFFAALAAHAEEAPLVVALRADRLTDVSRDAPFARLVERGLFLLTAMDGPDLRAAIEGPAHQAGVLLEPGLVDLLVRDVEGEPGALPLLSHALRKTWEAREGRTLTVAGYRQTGGIRGAVAQTAEEVYAQAASAQRPILRDLLLRLVTTGPDGEPIRVRVPRRQVAGDPEHEELVELLVGARLVTSDDGVVELAHEAVARAWPRLRGWLDDDVEGQRILRHLTVAADTWEAMGRPESELYRGVRLTNALDWRERARPRLSATERAFLDTSAKLVEAEQRTAEHRARYQLRVNRRLRGLLTATALFLVVALLAGVVAVQRGRDTARQRDTAALEALVNRSLALRSTDRATAALLAVEAYRRAPDDPRAHSALLGTFTAAPGFLGYRHLPGDDLLSGAAVPGTSTAVVALDGGDLKLIDLDSGKLDDHFPPSDVTPSAVPALRPSLVRVSADGRFVVHMTTTESSELCLEPQAATMTGETPCVAFSVYELDRGRRVLGPITPSFGVGDVAINADGSLIAVAGGYDGELAIYRTADGELLGTVAGLARPDTLLGDASVDRDTAAVAFGPDGTIYLGSLEGPIRVVDPATVQVVRTLDAPRLSSNVNLVVTTDGLLVGTGRAAIVAVDTSTGTTRWSADIFDTFDIYPCVSFAITPVGGRLYCGNGSGVVVERELATGQRTGLSFDGQLGPVGDLAIASDERELVAFGRVPVISRWQLDGGGAVIDRIADGHMAFNGYDPTGKMLLVMRRDSIQGPPPIASNLDHAVWDPVSDEAIDELDGKGAARWFGRDRITDGITLYDVRAHARVTSGEPRPPVPYWVHMSPDGDRTYGAVVFDDPRTGPRCEIRTYDPDRRRRIEPTIELKLGGDCSWQTSMSGTRDGGRVVVTTGAANYNLHRTTVHDGQSGKQLAGPLRGPIVTSVSPDGVLVGGDGSGAITQYDLDTLEPIGTFPGTRGQVAQLSFSADGKILVAISWNQTVSIYDVASRTRLGDPIANDSAGPSGSLRPDGKAVVTNAPQGVAVWDIDPEHLADAACQLAGRNLTPTEWDTYLANPGDHRATCPT